MIGAMQARAFPAWVDGRWVQPGEPAIAADDQGLQLGLSVFDSLLWEGGRFYFLAAHMQRLAEGAAELGIPIGGPGGLDAAGALDAYVRRLIADEGWDAPLMLRVTVTRGRAGGQPTLIVTARHPEQLDPAGVDVTLAEVQKAAGDHHEQIKSTNRMRNVLALEHARGLGAWEALFTTTDGHLSEGTMTNVFLVTGQPAEPGAPARLFTPALEHGCLSGITRRVLIDALRAAGHTVEEGAVPLAELSRASEAFLTNTSQRVVPIRHVRHASGAIFPTNFLEGRPITRIAKALVHAAEAAEVSAT